MQDRTRTTNALLVVLGLVLACCWFPRGVTGLLTLLRVATPGIRPPEFLGQLLHVWADPLGWYGMELFRRGGHLGFRVLAFLSAAPNCLCGLMAAAVILLVVFLALRNAHAAARGPGGTDR